MEEEIIPTEEAAEERPVYTPRPKWQIVAAWIGIAIMVIGFVLYCLQIAGGGLS